MNSNNLLNPYKWVVNLFITNHIHFVVGGFSFSIVIDNDTIKSKMLVDIYSKNLKQFITI